MSRWKKCAVETCCRVAEKKGLCTAHYARVLSTGSLRPEVPIKRKEANEKRYSRSV